MERKKRGRYGHNKVTINFVKEKESGSSTATKPLQILIKKIQVENL